MWSVWCKRHPTLFRDVRLNRWVVQLEPLKTKADMLFRNGEQDLLSDTQSHPKGLNHRLPGYKTVKSRISPCNLKEQQLFMYKLWTEHQRVRYFKQLCIKDEMKLSSSFVLAAVCSCSCFLLQLFVLAAAFSCSFLFLQLFVLAAVCSYSRWPDNYKTFKVSSIDGRSVQWYSNGMLPGGANLGTHRRSRRFAEEKNILHRHQKFTWQHDTFLNPQKATCFGFIWLN